MRILVVDDQKLNQIRLQALLTNMGHSVVCADNGQQALDIYADIQPQLVLLDVVMPVMDGFSTAPQLKKLSGDVHLPIIFITALESQETLLKCLEVGGDDFLTTPFEPVVLQAKIKAHARVRELSYSLAEKNTTLNWHSNRMEREQAVVSHMLRNALQENELDHPSIDYMLRSATTFNGDLCLGKQGPLGNYYLFLGDFTGHGLAPATGTLPVSQAFFSMAERGVSVGDMAREFNHRLLKLLPDDMFCAALIIELSAGGERLSCWNGGLPDALIINSQGRVEHTIKPRHMALGIIPDEQFDAQVEHLMVAREQSLIAFTDGVVEVETEDNQRLSEESFKHLVTSAWQLEPDERFASLADHISTLIDNQSQHDDASLVMLSFAHSQHHSPMALQEHNHLPFSLHISIGRRELFELDPVQELVDSLGKLEAIAQHKTTLYLLFAECFNNIVEHNLLGLQSDLKESRGFEYYYQQRQRRLAQLTDVNIDINIRYCPVTALLEFEIGSDGQRPYSPSEQSETPTIDSDHVYGRGLQLLNSIAQQVEWRDQGQRLYLAYDLNHRPV